MAFDDTKVREYLRTTHETPLLTEREEHLIGLAVTMTRGCQVCTRNRIEKARAAGIGDDVLNALIAVASSVNAGVTVATARKDFGWSTQRRPRIAARFVLWRLPLGAESADGKGIKSTRLTRKARGWRPGSHTNTKSRPLWLGFESS